MITAVSTVFVGAFGAAFGSFFNVVAHRLPAGISLLRPPSACPGCETPIRPYDNIPILGWLLLRGRCRTCRAPISVSYPVVELTTALLAVGVVLTKHSAAAIVLGLVLVATLVPVSLIDLERRLIPNVITAPAAVAAVALGLALHPAGVPEQLIAGAAGGGFLLLFAVAYPRGMGMGDVKLAAVLGLFLGREVGVALAVGVISATLVGIGIMARLGVEKGRKTAVPFGPFLALGGLVALYAGAPIIHWYRHSVV